MISRARSPSQSMHNWPLWPRSPKQSACGCSVPSAYANGQYAGIRRDRRPCVERVSCECTGLADAGQLARQTAGATPRGLPCVTWASGTRRGLRPSPRSSNAAGQNDPAHRSLVWPSFSKRCSAWAQTQWRQSGTPRWDHAICAMVEMGRPCSVHGRGRATPVGLGHVGPQRSVVAAYDSLLAWKLHTLGRPKQIGSRSQVFRPTQMENLLQHSAEQVSEAQWQLVAQVRTTWRDLEPHLIAIICNTRHSASCTAPATRQTHARAERGMDVGALLPAGSGIN